MDKKGLKSKLLVLEEEVQALIEQVESASKPVELDQSSVGRLSRMDAMQNQAMALANKTRQNEQLHKIRTALRNIERDDFGRCVECDNHIAEGRLLLDPTHIYCVSCASAIE
jgi:DnaK suppressor protein